MSRDQGTGGGLGRRELLGAGVRSAALLAVLPVAPLGLAACGGEDPDAGPSMPVGPEPGAPAAKGTSPQAQAPAPVAQAPVVPKPASDAGGELVTEVAASAPIVSAIQYVNESPEPDQNCGNCQLYTAGADGRGRCTLFAQGLVKETGWCVSWVAAQT